MQQRDPHEEMNHDETTCQGGCCEKGAAYDPPTPSAPAGTVMPTVVLRLSVRNHPLGGAEFEMRLPLATA